MKKSIITEPLGLFGWEDIEPVLLASLASEYPMLLIGKHGCAKSFVLERLATELKMEYRFYNASLINYDDLVGIPIPTSDHKSLEYISSSESIWDAEIVFIDEINRCKVELQNKMFPIIYDKRVQGINLEKLKYRWAAMNPPTDIDEDYQGTVELDKALSDRFPFIIKVPEYSELSDANKRKMLEDVSEGRHEFKANIFELINKTKALVPQVKKEIGNVAIEYIMCLSELLLNKFKYVSSRRVSMLYETLIYTYAALKVLDENSSFEDAIYSHIKYVLPMRANENIDDSMLINLAAEAISISKIDSNKSLLLMEPGINKLVKLLKYYQDIDDITLNEIVSSSIASIENEKERRIMALFTFIKLKENKKICASTMEILYSLSRVFYSGESKKELVNLERKRIKDKVDALLSEEQAEEYYSTLNNVLNYYCLSDDSFRSEDEVIKIKNFFKEKYKEIFK